jgi:hypothetical protein
LVQVTRRHRGWRTTRSLRLPQWKISSLVKTLDFSAGDGVISANQNGLPRYAFDPRGVADMQKISEYQRHAAECRKMAARSRNSLHKKQLEEIARAWEMLADVRMKHVERKLSRGPFERARLQSMPRN